MVGGGALGLGMARKLGPAWGAITPVAGAIGGIAGGTIAATPITRLNEKTLYQSVKNTLEPKGKQP